MSAEEDATLRLYSVKQLAELWNVSEWFIRDEIKAGRLATVQIGRGDRNKLRVPAPSAQRWVNAHLPTEAAS